jgi:hypothetical protein
MLRKGSGQLSIFNAVEAIKAANKKTTQVHTCQVVGEFCYVELTDFARVPGLQIDIKYLNKDDEAPYKSITITATYGVSADKKANEPLDIAFRSALSVLHHKGVLTSRDLDGHVQAHAKFLKLNDIDSLYHGKVSNHGASYRPGGNAF